MRNFNIRTKLLLWGIATVFFSSLAIIAIGVWQGNIFGARARVEVEKLIDADLNHITESVYNLIKAQDESIQMKVNYDLNVARYVLSREGAVSLAEKQITWNAVNQFTGDARTISLPTMKVGRKLIGQNRQLFVETPVVDLVKRLVGGTATIFQRVNKEGDILRVATNVENLDGTRAIGTYIPAVNPDGTPNPVVSAVMRGKTYRGIAYVVNAWYVTAYEPIIDDKGAVIGALYVGVKEENIESLRQAIIKLRIGKTGYVFILGGKGGNRGKYIISKNGQRDGADTWNEKDAAGNPMTQNIVNKAVKLRAGEFATERYIWQNPDEPKPRWKIAKLAYYEPWDWIIGASVYEDELQDSIYSITAGYRKMIYGFAAVALCVSAIGGLFTWLYARRITHPLQVVTGEASRMTTEDFPRLLEAIRAVENGDLSVQVRFDKRAVEVHLKDEIGTLARTFESMNSVLAVVGGAFTNMVGNLRELTQRLEEKVEERTTKLRESERKMSDIIEFLPDATMVVDHRGRIVAWNKAIETLTGMSALEVIGKGDQAYAVPFHGKPRVMLIDQVMQPDQSLLEDHYMAVRGVGKALIGEAHTPNLPGGPRFLLETAVALSDAAGNITGAIEIIHDITIRKQAEEEMKKAKEIAESANRAKSSFLAMMSHEIRTPMNAIVGMSSLLLNSPLTSQQRDFTETIRTSSDALLAIINDILDFSKIEAGKLDLEHVPVDLRGCVESALDLLGHRARGKGLDLGCLIDSHTPAAIIGDSTRLTQVLVNLIGNAIKFTDKGEVTVTVTSVSPEKTSSPADGTGWQQDASGQLAEIHFTVRDTGIGIPQEKMDRLFQSFSQVDSSTSRRFGGTGLGLAISKRLVEMMNGSIWAESEEGRGSQFHFTIRARVAEGSNPLYLSGNQPLLRGKRVLIVDDNPTHLQMMATQLESWGMETVQSASGSEAIAMIGRGERFDLVFIDMLMPEMDGLDLGEAIRGRHGALSLPMIMVSAVASELKDPRLAFFSAVLAKPVRSSRLYDSVIEALGGIEPTHRPAPIREEEEINPEMGKNHPLTILLAEDNAINQKIANALLERLGYRADIAVNGLEAVEALRHRQYDVVFMDIQMPEMDGLDAARTIRSSFGIEEQPRIVAMTANAMQGDREECLAAGMDDYVSKPIIVRDLVVALQKCKRRAAAEDPGNV